jgi:hypothetical protein
VWKLSGCGVAISSLISQLVLIIDDQKHTSIQNMVYLNLLHHGYMRSIKGKKIIIFLILVCGISNC